MTRFRLPALAAAAALVGAAIATPASAAVHPRAAYTYAPASVELRVSGTTVTAWTHVRVTSGSVAFTELRVCAHTGTSSTAGSPADFPGKAETVTTAGVELSPAPKTFAPGTYTFFVCGVTGGTWYDWPTSGNKTITIGAAPSAAPSLSVTPTVTPSPSVTPSATPTVTPTPSPSVTPGAVPNAPLTATGQVFNEDFDSPLDPAKWAPCWYPKAGDDCGVMNNVTTRKSNVSIANGEARLQLSDGTHGSLITTNFQGNTAGSGFRFSPGQYAEARLILPGTGVDCDNWGAFWTVGAAPWPGKGEFDVVEPGARTGTAAQQRKATSNYHYTGRSGSTALGGVVPGSWCDGATWHTYGVHYTASRIRVYWDGLLVQDWANGHGTAGHELILNQGTRPESRQVLGQAGAVRADYVKVWTVN